MLRYGKISEVGTGKNKGFARVSFDELNIVSGWLGLPTYSTKDKVQFISLPVNTQVAVLMHPDGEQGEIVKACWSTEHPAPSWGNETTDGIEYANGDKFTHSNSGFEFNGGANGGLTKTPELKTQLEKTNSLLTALITIINGAPIPEPGNGVASALQAALKGALVGQSLGVYTGIENTKVKH